MEVDPAALEELGHFRRSLEFHSGRLGVPVVILLDQVLDVCAKTKPDAIGRRLLVPTLSGPLGVPYRVRALVEELPRAALRELLAVLYTDPARLT